MHRPPVGRQREHGAALIYVLLLLVISITAATLIATSLSIDMRSRKEDARRIRLMPLLDSAVAEALAALADDPNAAGYEPHPFGGGEIGSEIATLPDGRFEIAARASYAGQSRAVVAQVVLGPYGPRVVAWTPQSFAGTP
jgi:hypothetical protein